MNKIIGQLLRIRRKELGLSLKKVSEMTGLHISYLSEVETGQRAFKTDKLEKILQVLDIKSSDFMMEVAKYIAEDEKKKNIDECWRSLLKTLTHKLEEFQAMIEKQTNEGGTFSIVKEKSREIYEVIREIMKIENQVKYIRENVPDDRSYFQKEETKEDNGATADADAES